MIYILISICVVLLAIIIAMFVEFSRTKRNFEKETERWDTDWQKLEATIRLKDEKEIENKEELEKQVQIERKNGELMLERAVTYEEKFSELGRIYGKLTIEKGTLEEEIELWKKEASKQLSHRKSSEVRTGQLSEHMAPLLDDFPYDFKCARFLGAPLDYIVFCDNGIHFVEVKSGNSQLSTKQRELKRLIEDGKVSFEIYRLKK